MDPRLAISKPRRRNAGDDQQVQDRVEVPQHGICTAVEADYIMDRLLLRGAMHFVMWVP